MDGVKEQKSAENRRRAKAFAGAAAAAAAVAVVAAVAGWAPWSGRGRDAKPAAAPMSDAQKAKWVEENPAQALADRVPPPQEGTAPPRISEPASGPAPAKGVTMGAAPKIAPPKARIAAIEAPSAEMMAAVAAKGGKPVLAVDKDGFATLPSGERARVSMSAPEARPATRGAAEMRAAQAVAEAAKKEEQIFAKSKAALDGNGNPSSTSPAPGRIKRVWIKTGNGERLLLSVETRPAVEAGPAPAR